MICWALSASYHPYYTYSQWLFWTASACSTYFRAVKSPKTITTCDPEQSNIIWEHRLPQHGQRELRSPSLPLPSSCAGPCGSAEWQLWCLLWNSLWHLPPRGTLNHQPTGATPTGRAEALRFLPWMTSDTPSLCLVALKRQWWGFLPSQAAGCNWCGRDVSTNLLLSDGLSVSRSSTRLRDLPHQPLQTAT